MGQESGGKSFCFISQHSEYFYRSCALEKRSKNEKKNIVYRTMSAFRNSDSWWMWKSETDDAKTQKSEAKEEDEWEETPVAPIEKEDLKKIGVPLKGTVEIKLENNTGKSITGFAVKKSENSEFGENLLEDEDVYVKGEKRYFYYDYKQENSEEETETISADYDGNTEEETDESVPEYDIQITYLNGTTAVLHNFPFDDMKEGTLELEDEITYLTYTSIKTKKEVDTKDERAQYQDKRRNSSGIKTRRIFTGGFRRTLL